MSNNTPIVVNVFGAPSISKMIFTYKLKHHIKKHLGTVKVLYKNKMNALNMLQDPMRVLNYVYYNIKAALSTHDYVIVTKPLLTGLLYDIDKTLRKTFRSTAATLHNKVPAFNIFTYSRTFRGAYQSHISGQLFELLDIYDIDYIEIEASLKTFEEVIEKLKTATK